MTKRLCLFVLAALLSVAPAAAQTDFDASSVSLWSGGSRRGVLTTGSGAPSAGATGDWYVDYATGDLYTKRSGTWSVIPRLEVANVWTLHQTVSNTEPSLFLNETDQGSNLKLLKVGVQGGALQVQTVNDAGSSVLATTLSLSRAGVLAVPGGVTAPLTGNVTGDLTGQVLTATQNSITSIPNLATVGALNSGSIGTGFGAINVGADAITGGAIAGTTGAFSSTLGVTGAASFSGVVGEPSYVSQTTAWRVTPAGAGDFRNLYTDEMRAKIFTADLEQVTRGSALVTKSFGTLSAPFTCPIAAGTATLTVFDAPEAPNVRLFATNDWVVLRLWSRTDGDGDGNLDLTIGDCVGQVSAYSDGAGVQSWTFTRGGTGASAGNMPSTTVVPVNNIAIDYGPAGSGYTVQSATDGAEGANAPYFGVNTFVTAPLAANTTSRCRLGNLNGITAATEYGLLCGNFSGNAYVRFSDQNAEITGIPLILKDGGTVTMKMDPAVPSFALGSTLPSAYGTGTGVWTGKDSGAYKFRVGDPSGNRLTWDNSILTIQSADLLINGAGISLPADTSGYSATKAYRFTRNGNGGGAGDHYGLFAFGATTNQELWLENLPVPSPTSNSADAILTISARGWNGGTTSGASTAQVRISSPATVGADDIRLTTSNAYAMHKFRSGLSDDSTTYTQANSNLLAGNNGEAVGVAGSASLSNFNFYLQGVAQRKATLQAVGGVGASNNGGRLAVFTKDDTSSGADVVQACYWDFSTGGAGGGFVCGAPTGGSKGAGSINAKAVYDDNVLLSDSIFDLHYDGRTAFPNPGRLYSLAEVQAVTESEHRLPWMPTKESFEQDRVIGGMITRLWRGQEQQQIYFFDINARLAALEAEIAALRAGRRQ